RGHILGQPSDIVELRHHYELRVRAELAQFLGREGTERPDLDEPDIDTLILAQPDGLTGLRRGAARGNDDGLGPLHVLRRAQAAHVLLDIAPRALYRCPDFLLPDRMDVVRHEVALLDGRIAGQAGWRILR